MWIVFFLCTDFLYYHLVWIQFAQFLHHIHRIEFIEYYVDKFINLLQILWKMKFYNIKILTLSTHSSAKYMQSSSTQQIEWSWNVFLYPFLSLSFSSCFLSLYFFPTIRSQSISVDEMPHWKKTNKQTIKSFFLNILLTKPKKWKNLNLKKHKQMVNEKVYNFI